MNRIKQIVVLIFVLTPTLIFGQIPKGHFLDADSTGEKGAKIKPFIQKEKGIYHYAVLSQLPFENNCSKRLSEKKKINCSEDALSELIRRNIKSNSDYKGRVYVYLTVTEKSEITDVDVTSYPESIETNLIVKNATESLNVRPAEYKSKIVKARLWTFLVFE